MKRLLFFLIFTPILGLSQVQEIVTTNEANQIISSIKDVEVQKMLEETKEFNTCREMYKFQASDSPEQRSSKLAEAQKCFQKQLGNTSSEKLKNLSESLNLQHYGLVKGSTSREIQEYLNKKMYKSLTGINPDEADKQKLIESLKFKNRKHIDQRTFITLYKNQLTKNSLYEVSRFCFDKFRRRDPSTAPANFGDYWEANFDENKTSPADYTDLGEPSFSSFQNTDDKEEVYSQIFKNINGQKFNKWDQFFKHCGKMIKILCDDYKKSLKPEEAKSMVGKGASGSMTVGASSCLSLSRLQEYRQALEHAEKIDNDKENGFAALQNTTGQEQLLSGLFSGDPKIFGHSSNDESLDSLTSHTSSDILEGGATDRNKERLDKCSDTPEIAECEGFFGREEEFLQVQHRVETELTLRREVEIARVRELKKKNDASLEDYLKDNGFFGILETMKSDSSLSEDALVNLISQEFEARKMATLESIQNKLGSRQLKDDAEDDKKKDVIRSTAKEAAGERARLAQVVLFNNIITSQLELTRRDGNGNESSAGRNVNAWKKEETALKERQVDEELFSNLQIHNENNGAGGGIGQNDQLGGLGFIEAILGKPEEPSN